MNENSKENPGIVDQNMIKKAVDKYLSENTKEGKKKAMKPWLGKFKGKSPAQLGVAYTKGDEELLTALKELKEAIRPLSNIRSKEMKDYSNGDRMMGFSDKLIDKSTAMQALMDDDLEKTGSKTYEELREKKYHKYNLKLRNKQVQHYPET